MNRPSGESRPGSVLVALAIAAAIAPSPAWAQEATVVDPAAAASAPGPLAQRLRQVRALVDASSAARQIEASANPGALSQRNKARQLVRLAEEAVAARDERSAASLLNEATRQLFEGARLAKGEGAAGGNLARDVAARIEAAQALLAAQRRISAEKTVAGSAEAVQQVEKLLGEARAQAGAQRHAEAQPLAQQAYFLAKAAIGALRSGDTLVRTLKFASKEEEYHYEIDRNDTHRMLLDLLARRQASEDSGTRALVAKAGELRRQAEASAGRGAHAAAVDLLEASTRELVRAIRSAGVFIPG